MGIRARTDRKETASTMARPNEKHKIIEHYDLLSPYYHSLWGEHLHHGYWIRGDESKDAAQIQLIEHLARLAKLTPGARVLDIGCGYGGSSLYLAKHYGARATGITISAVQVEMANRGAANQNLDAKFLLMDAESLDFAEPFDVLWSMESISHYHDPGKFFASATKFLKPGGTFALTDWFRKEGLSAAEKKKFIAPIDKAMFVELREMDEYATFLAGSGLRITHRQDLTQNCAKTWDVGLEIIKNKSFWSLAAKLGPDFLTYLKGYQAVRAAISSGNFVYGLFVAEWPDAREKVD